MKKLFITACMLVIIGWVPTIILKAISPQMNPIAVTNSLGTPNERPRPVTSNTARNTSLRNRSNQEKYPEVPRKISFGNTVTNVSNSRAADDGKSSSSNSVPKVTLANTIEESHLDSSTKKDASEYPLDDRLSPFRVLGKDNRTKARTMPEDLKEEPEYSTELDDPSLKRILLWNDMYGKPHYTFGLGREPFIRAGCPINQCVTTSNRTRYPLSQIDALVWHFRSEDKILPNERTPHTRYVFWMQESPMNLYGDIQDYDGIFNWTFTYRLDSDFPTPAGFMMDQHEVYNKTLTFEMTQRKSKLIAWFVSNCKSSSGRESLVRSLQQYLPVDIYGICGPYKCNRSQQTKCYEMLERDYKFYLSFENSLCRDYITEKFFHLLQYDIIPIVWGSGNYSFLAPKHSYINAADYDSVKELAEYITYLDKNITAYLEYFRWKEKYQAITGWAATVRPWCDLCARLHKDHTTQVYEDLHGWFSTESNCQSPKSPVIARYVHGENKHEHITSELNTANQTNRI